MQQQEQVEEVKKNINSMDLKVFKYQFILNYLSKPNANERQRAFMEVYGLISEFKEVFLDHLIPTLKEKQVKKKETNQLKVVQRESKFFEKELKLVDEMLQGKYKFEKMESKN